MLVADRGFVLQLPHQYVDKVGVLDNNGHLFKHVFEADASLLQAGGTETQEVKQGYKGPSEGGDGKHKWHDSECMEFIQQYIKAVKGRDSDTIGIWSN